METAEQAVRTPAPRQRRVGTFTLGVTLVAAGAGMLASMFLPQFRPEWLLQASPCVLILLGAETLVSCRNGAGVKYDWVGMLLCILLTGAALCLYAAAWWMVQGPGIPAYNGTWDVTGNAVDLRYDYFNDGQGHTLALEAGDVLEIRCGNAEGWLDVEVYGGEDWGTVFDREMTGQDEARVEIPADGDYHLWIRGHRARGRISFTRVPPEEGAAAPAEEAYPGDAPLE